MSEQVYGQLTLFQEGFLASPLVLPGSKEARRMTATSGRKWLGLSKNCGPLGLLEKMLLGSLRWHSLIFYLNWKPVDIGQGHFLFQLALSEPDIVDTGSQLWGIPNTMDYLPQRSPEAPKRQAEGSRKGRTRPANLREQVDPETVRQWEEPRIWKTPTTMEIEHPEIAVTQNGRRATKDGKNSHSIGLADQVRLWPTPRAHETGCYQMSGKNRDRKSLTLTGAAKMYNTPTAQDTKNSTLPASQMARDSLVGDVMREMFATPQARDYRTGQASRWEDTGHRSRNLNDQIAMFPTPTTGAGLCGGSGNYQQLKRLEAGGTITEKERKSMSQGNGGQLNPDWVEWLMGFPVGWTEVS